MSEVLLHPPLIHGDQIPDYWSRIDTDGTVYLFLAQWLSKDLKYPVYSGQSFMDAPIQSDFEIFVHGKLIKKSITFNPYQSIVLKISADGEIEQLDISFIPKDPEIRPREKQRMHF